MVIQSHEHARRSSIHRHDAGFYDDYKNEYDDYDHDDYDDYEDYYDYDDN